MTEPPPSSATTDAGAPGPLRVILQQPALPKYRIPVFRELAARPRLDVTVLYSGGSDIPAAAADGFEARRVRERILLRRPRQLRWEPAQIASASRRKCDVLVLEWNAGVASLIPALLLARLRGIGTVLWGHGYSKREQPVARAVRNAVGRMADCLLLYNHMAADAIVACGFRPDRIFVALNALDQTPIARARDTWRVSPGRMQEFRESHGVAGRRIVLFVSRLEADNGLDLLIGAAASLKDTRPELTVAIIGHGPAQQDLERLSAELGVADRVRFLGAIYEEDQLAPWFLAADMFCYPRNIGLSLLHAFGYGLPVITDDNLRAQNPEIEALRDGENGLLYRAGDTGALAAAIDRLLTDEPLRQRLGAEAERTVAEQFTLANMVDGMEAAVRAAAKRRKR